MTKRLWLATALVLIVNCASQGPSVVEKNSNTHSATESSSVEIISFHDQFLKHVNITRSRGRKCGKQFFPAAPALSLNSKLNQAAHKHSEDMFKYQFLEHTSSNGDTLVERMQAVNYSWRAVAENIAHNQKSIEQVIDDWLSSPGHCSNMMSADYIQTGIANVNRFWTQVYATPK